MHAWLKTALPANGRVPIALLAALLVGVGALSQTVAGADPLPEAPEVSSGWNAKSAVTSRHWMVAAANPLAVDAGYRMLQAGGSAVDAAIAMQLVLGLVEPQSSGLGGGAFMLVHDARRNRLIAYDGRETAPLAATPDRFLQPDGQPRAFHAAVVGGRSVGVPGVVRLLAVAHGRHGRLPWRQLFQPAIDLAEKGFPVSPRLHTLIASETHFEQDRVRSYFLDAAGLPLAVGTLLRNPAYAATLKRLQKGGADAFYRGAIADDIIATANGFARNPGDLTRADLAGYEVKVREPVCDGYRGYRVCGVPPPSSGGLTLLAMLKMLEPYPVAAMGPASFWSVHFMSEAGSLAFADRDAWIADPDFFPVPAGLLDPDYLRARSQLIRTDRVLGHAAPGIPPGVVPAGLPVTATGSERGIAIAQNLDGTPPTMSDAALHGRLQSAPVGDIAATPEFPSTSHLVVVDAAGNAVSMTTTIEDQFGSRLMTAGGFLLNNELTDFSFVPERDGKPIPNRVQPGKRPRSAMAPTIVYDRKGRVFLLLGSPGGSAIINYVAKTLLAVIDWQLDPQAAIALGNFGSRNGPIELEGDTPVTDLAGPLRAFGHAVVVGEHTSGVQAIMRTPGGWIGGADPRREGVVRGQ
jgi:gamma-glutamyltranspeptidase/glutathione hydrolase